jgi:hypothetical protein
LRTPICGVACHTCQVEGALFLEVARDAGLALRHMTPLPLQRQNPTHHEPGRLTIGGPATGAPFSSYAACRLVNLVRPNRCFRGGSPPGPSLSGCLACNSSSQRHAKRNQNSRSALLAALSDWERHCLICSRKKSLFSIIAGLSAGSLLNI